MTGTMLKIISRVANFLIFSTTSLLISNVIYLGFSAATNIVVSKNIFWLISAILLGLVMYVGRKYYKYFRVDLKQSHILLLLLYLIPIILRFPMVYPTHDDLASHFMLGDYAQNLWTMPHFMPENLITYFYPAVDMLYTPFLFSIGIRLTILLFYIILSLWMVSIYARWSSQLSNEIHLRWLFIVFILTPFIPHLMATHGTLMVDHISVVLTIESLYFLIHKNTNKTLGCIFFLLSMIAKQSTSIFVVPILGYYTWVNRKEINWLPIAFISVLISLFFVRSYFETGNPVMGLYNGLFHSPLYEQDNFSNPRFGPENFQQTILWPIIGQFGERYGEVVVAKYAMILFSPISIMGYLGSLYLSITKRKIKYVLIFLSYLMWSVVVGYSRYIIPLNILALLILSQEMKIKIPKALILIYAIVCLSSFKTDFSWRPYPSFNTLSANKIFFDKYLEGLKWVGHDNLSIFATDLAPVFNGYEAVVPVYRGTATFFSYVGSLNGLQVIGGYPKVNYERVQSSDISLAIKANQTQLQKLNRFLLVVDEPHQSYMDNVYIPEKFTCIFIDNGPLLPYLGPDAFEKLSIYSCQ